MSGAPQLSELDLLDPGDGKHPPDAARRGDRCSEIKGRVKAVAVDEDAGDDTTEAVGLGETADQGTDRKVTRQDDQKDRIDESFRPVRDDRQLFGAAATFVGFILIPAFLPAIIAIAIVFVVGVILFALIGRHRLVLSPEEEYALSGGMHGDPQKEGYDAMEGEVFGDKPKK